MEQVLDRIVMMLRKLTAAQRQIIGDELAALSTQSEVSGIIEKRFSEVTQCPHCQCTHVIRHGQANGMQRYRCRGCAKTFSALTGTPLCGLHKRDKWLEQAEALRTGQPLRAVARCLDIHLGTAHRWRHRFLSFPKTLQPRSLTGIAEADETYFLLSFKGKRSELGRPPRKRGGKASRRGLSQEQVPVLVARDRSGATLDCVLKRSDQASLAAALKPFIAKDVVLCSDGATAFASAAREMGVEHHALNLSAGVRVEGPWHIQNVNAYHSRLKGWIYHFRGVATCYLENYLGWFRALDRASDSGPSPKQWLAMALGEPMLTT